MRGKRTLAQNEQPSLKLIPNSPGMKRRKLLHDGAGNQSPNSVGGKQQAFKAQDGGLEPPRGTSGTEKQANKGSKSAQGLVPQEDQRIPHSRKWSVAHCSSGRFLNLDPIFTSDGRYMILATENAAQVFSIATSCVVRTLPTHESGKLAALGLPPKTGDRLYTSTTSGAITRWNWQSGMETQICKKPYPVVAIDPQIADGPPGNADVFLFTLCQREKGRREISVILDSDGRSTGKSLVVLETSTPLSGMKVVAGGKAVVAWAGDRLLIGLTSSQLMPGSFTSTKYAWREVKLPVCVTSVDARFTVPSSKNSKKAPVRAEGIGNLDIALGESGGSILIYYDILNRLIQHEKSQKEENLISNRLHWHRKAVKAIKWSRDGNYIISGGLETVLVLWQLDTGRQQFLPHLSSPICNLVVSPTGTSYAIKLGDNSVMILSTAELRPVANISGLQLPFNEDIHGRTLEVKGYRAKSNHCGHGSSKLPALLHPIHPNHLLIAAPSTQILSSATASASASVLQAFDIRSGQHISRQALTRTNVSVVTSGPQGTEVTTPDMKLVAISPHGDWLATVDEWQQYPEDANILHLGVEGDSFSGQPEMFMKFWHWDDPGKEWQLVTRIDKPHFFPSGGSARTLGLTVQSEGLGFATVGSDAVVRQWAPERQHRSNRNGNDTKQSTVRKWRCSRTVVLRKQTDTSRHASACIAFSNDDSILAVCWPGNSHNDPSLVHLIDPISGSIRCSKGGLFSGVPSSNAFLDRYLVILSDRLVVWDIVSDEVKFTLVIEHKCPDSLLAVNPSSQTFAVSFTTRTESNQRRDPEHELAIFEPTSPRPVFRSRMKDPVRSLLPDLRTGDYVVVDAAAQIMRVSCGDRTQVSAAPVLPAENMQTGLENLFGRQPAQSDDSDAFGRVGYEKDVSGAGSLATIFDSAPPFALPTVDVLFQNVVDVFSRESVIA